ncbi:hypothetical protein ACWEVD_18490 [Nocardia thailandica]
MSTHRRRVRSRSGPVSRRPTVEQRLDAADHLLTGEVPAAGGVWSRAVAWILRLALEQAVDELWFQVAPELVRCPMRAQLLALRVYAGPTTAGEVGALWAALSRAAHHHDYELAPSTTDLRRWRDQTAELARALALAPLAHQPFG